MLSELATTPVMAEISSFAVVVAVCAGGLWLALVSTTAHGPPARPGGGRLPDRRSRDLGHPATPLGAGLDPRRRADRRGRPDRDPVRRRHARRVAAAAPLDPADCAARDRGHVPDCGAGCRRRPDHPARVLDDGRDHRRRARSDRSGGDVLGAGPAGHRRARLDDPRGRGWRERPGRDRARGGPARVRVVGRVRVERRRRLRARDGRRRRLRDPRRVRARAGHARKPAPPRGPEPGADAGPGRPHLRRRDAAARLGLPGGVRGRRPDRRRPDAVQGRGRAVPLRARVARRDRRLRRPRPDHPSARHRLVDRRLRPRPRGCARAGGAAAGGAAVALVGAAALRREGVHRPHRVQGRRADPARRARGARRRPRRRADLPARVRRRRRVGAGAGACARAAGTRARRPDDGAAQAARLRAFGRAAARARGRACG